MLRFICCFFLAVFIPNAFGDVYFFKGQATYLQKLSEEDRYLNHKGNVVRISDSFFIKQDKELSVILDKYGLHLVKTYSNNLHKVQPKTKTTDLLALIGKVDADKLTEYAYPNFIKKIKAR